MEIERFHRRLLSIKMNILKTLAEIENESLSLARSKDPPDIAAEPGDLADLGSQRYEWEMAFSLAESERRILLDVQNALQKIEEGTYGLCEGTGRPIEKKRLQALPYARYWKQYACQREKSSPPDYRPADQRLLSPSLDEE